MVVCCSQNLMSWNCLSRNMLASAMASPDTLNTCKEHNWHEQKLNNEVLKIIQKAPVLRAIEIYYEQLQHTSHVRANPARLGIRSSNDATRINCCRLALIFSMVNLLD